MTSQPPMIIDSFAGGGGASTGIEQALGRAPDVAINHSGPALALHAANHPDTLHLNSNIWDVKPLEVTKGRHVGLLWASPDCKHFSKAKGGAPRDSNIRDLAWIVVDWAEQAKPDVICMENVEEFVTWGPLGNDGQPLKEFTGQTFELWIGRLKRAGYKVQWRELRACDYGAPTIRKRWFLVARRDGLPIIWPKPTHGDPKSAAVKRGKLRPWRTAAECIDWSIPCPSIFDTKDEVLAKHGLRSVRPLAHNTMARIARGMKRYVIDADRPFLVEIGYGERKGQQPRTQDIDAPLATVVAGSVKHALITPSITRFNGGATGQQMCDPLATVTANSWIKRPGGAAPLGLLAPHLATMRNSQKPWQGADEPTHTITAGGAGLSLTTPYLASIAHGYSGGRREYPMSAPLGTVTVGGIQHALIAPHLLSLKNAARRSCAANTPHPTVLAGGGHSAIIAPVLTYAQQGGNNRNMLAPHHTICASRKDQNNMFAAFLAQHNGGPNMGGNAGHDIENPISTIAATGSHQTPIAAFFAKYYGTGDGARSDAPLHTVTVKDRMAHMQAALDAPPFTPEHEARARAVADFLRSHDAWDGGEFVTLDIAGQTFVVVDIGMRMLTPRELFNAQDFPPDYVIEGVWEGLETASPTFKAFPKDVQVSCCGNSVCPPLAKAIISANCGNLAIAETENQIALAGGKP